MPEVSYIGLPALIGRAMGAIEVAVGEAAEDLQGRAQSEAPVDTGTLRASIHVDGPRVGGTEVTALVKTGGESSEYAIPVHEGSMPHWIEPTTGYLWWPGAAHPVMRVFHPGAAPTKFLERPLIEMRPVYLAYLQRAAAAAF